MKLNKITFDDNVISRISKYCNKGAITVSVYYEPLAHKHFGSVVNCHLINKGWFV